MSRRDIAVILERLSLDHRTSLAEKSCAFLQAVESNGAVKNHPSHAAICIDIAAVQLQIDVSRPALIRLSGAASPLEYSSTLQKLTRLLTGKPAAAGTDSQVDSRKLAQTSSKVGSKSGRSTVTTSVDNRALKENSSSRHSLMRELLTPTTMSCLRQLTVQYGSIELEELVLECLDRFFDVWLKSLPPAQRIHVNYADAKWVGAAFWLCAMARTMTIGKDEENTTEKNADTADKSATSEVLLSTTGKKPTRTAAVKKIGGRGSKELKEIILTAVEHTVRKTELDTTIRLIEDVTQEYLLSLRKARGATNSTAAASSRRRKITSNGDETAKEGGDDNTVPAFEKKAPVAPRQRPQLEQSEETDKHRRMGTKRQVSNVSQLSNASDIDDGQEVHHEEGSSTASTTRSSKPALKRTRLDSQASAGISSSADIMSTTKRGTAARKTLKEATAESQSASQLLNQRRNAGGVYSMIPRVRYEQTRAFAQYQEWRTRMINAALHHSAASVPGPSLITQGKTHVILWAMAEEYVEQARSLCFIATTQPNSQPGWRKRHQDLIFTAIKCLVATVTVESPSMTQLDKAKSRLRLAQILFEETESVERCEEEINKAMAFWIVAGQYSLMLYNWDQAMFYLGKLTPHFGLDELLGSKPTGVAHPLPQSKTQSQGQAQAPSAQQQESCHSNQLRVFFLILYICCMLRSGRISMALTALTALHKALDETRPRDTEELQGIFKIHLKSHSEPSVHQQQHDVLANNVPSPYISIKWMSFSQVYCLTYLLSGICSKADMTQPMKAQLFLIEGIKVVDREFSVNDWGKLEEALEWYGICLDHSLRAQQDPEGYDAKTLAIINSALIYCGERHHNLSKARELQLEARSRHASAPSTSVLCALHILDSWTKDGLITARQHLQEALKLSSVLLNTQLRSLTLLLLGNVYLQAHDEQAEKMLLAGYTQARKTSNHTIAAAAGSCLKDLYLNTSQGIKASKQAQDNKPVQDALQQAFQLNPLAPLLNGTAN
ncbi:hypothetical protein BGX28_004157 [Mortierella sp. GBA30]|nr:hypothetical protein BGX28_004157 [Mortierella sp. GBA30]